MNTPSKRSMERANILIEKLWVCDWSNEDIKNVALAFDKLVEEACEVVDSPDFYIKPRDQRVQAIRLKLKGSPEGDTNRDSSKTASKGGEDGGN